MKRIKTIVEEYIAEGGAARLERRDGRDGVLFFLGLQVEDWVPLSSLGHNSGLGFYEINNCPHEENQSIPHDTGWIKVSDALPDSGESVLAAYTDATVAVVEGEVSLWMPWPELPAGE